MDTQIENLIVIYYELIYEANKVITDTPEPGNIEDYKKQTSFILRRIIHNCYRRLYTAHQHHLTQEDKDIILDSLKALFMNIHTRYGTRPISDLLERPWIL